MKSIIKKIVFNFIGIFVHFFYIFNIFFDFVLPKQLNGFFREKLVRKIDSIKKPVTHRNHNEKIKFFIHTPNIICSMRHRTFSDKEPETLEWIDEYGGNGTLYDVGANIGIYSIYYALAHPGNVYSFEPSVFNLRQLAKNISINKLQNKIRIITNPLSDRTHFSNFRNGNDMEGGALSAFGVDYGFDGEELQSEIEYNLMGISLDDLIDKGFIKEYPSLIKIDVDGIEHLILRGAKKTLRNETCKSISIEVNENFQIQADEVYRTLTESGFNLTSKKHSAMSAEGKFAKTFNQVWTRE